MQSSVCVSVCVVLYHKQPMQSSVCVCVCVVLHHNLSLKLYTCSGHNATRT